MAKFILSENKMKISKKLTFYIKNIVWLSITCLMALPLYLWSFLKGSFEKKLRILIIPPVKIGDLVCATPVFREIKKNFPESYLGVVLLADSGRRTTSYQLLKNNPYIDKIILPDKKRGIKTIGILKLIVRIYREKYNWSFTLTSGVIEKVIPFLAIIPNRVITISSYATITSKILNFVGNYKSEIKLNDLALRHYLRLLKFIGIKKFDQRKEIFISQKEKRKATQFLKKYNLNPNGLLIGIAVTAGNKLKEWPKEKFAQLSDRLIEEVGARIIFVGSPKDKKDISFVQSKMRHKSIDSSSELNLIELAALFRYLKLFISVDTGPLYMANAMEVPVVDILGPCSIHDQPPVGDNCEIVYKDLPCFPCSFVIKTARVCKYGHRKCVEGITINDVFNAAIRLLSITKRSNY